MYLTLTIVNYHSFISFPDACGSNKVGWSPKAKINSEAKTVVNDHCEETHKVHTVCQLEIDHVTSFEILCRIHVVKK